MSDLDSYINHCYDKLLNRNETAENQQDNELCACRKLVDYEQAERS